MEFDSWLASMHDSAARAKYRAQKESSEKLTRLVIFFFFFCHRQQSLRLAHKARVANRYIDGSQQNGELRVMESGISPDDGIGIG